MISRVVIFLLSIKLASSLVLKPVAVPLMEGGAILAKAGEALVSLTEEDPFNCYGGALSASGASLRNAGDCISQAGANARNKFGSEMVGDEAREGAVCLAECSEKMAQFINDESEVSLLEASKNAEMAGRIASSQGMKGGKGKQDDADREAMGKYLTGLSESINEVYSALKLQDVECKAWGVMCGHLENAAKKFELSSTEIRLIPPPKATGRSFLKG